jgi:hypothetical protein
MTTSIDTQTAQLIAHLRRGGNYCYLWAATQQKDSQGDALWKCTYWHNGSGPADLPADQHAQYGALNLYLGLHPVREIPQVRKRPSGTTYRPHPGNVRPLVEEVTALNALYAEYDEDDFGSKLAILAHIATLPALPSVIIDSGGGYHCYWLLDVPYVLDTPAARQRAKDIQARWVALVSGDDDAKDLSRVLRLPGTLNYKYTPARPVTFERAEFDRLYTLDTLEGELPAVALRKEKQASTTTLDLTGNVQRARHALQRLAKARCEQYSTWIAVGQALAELGQSGRDLWIEWSKGSDKFDEDVCIAKWATFRADPNGLTLASLFYWATEDDPDGTNDPRLAIDISTLDLPTVMPKAWDAMVAANDPPTLFRRGGELVRLERTESGALIIKTVDTRRMAGILARAARWVRVSYDKRGGATEKETIPPAAVVDDAMVNVDTRIPALTRIVHAPTFADGETLLTTPGYHPEARIYYDPMHGAVVPDVPCEPTAGDLERARALILDDLLIDFPFVSDPDRAHAVALFLLPFVRELIAGPTPLHLIEAPTMGSGKGLLADALLLPALGDTPTPMAEATTDEEWRKQITSNLLGAPAVIYIDNLNRMLASGALAAALTTREFSDRVLGKSEQVSLPVRCVWVAAANNPTLSTEISRRCIRIRIDPRVDKPWQREGFKHAKLRSWIETNRGDLIWAALVICRYGLQHGAAGTALGSYEAWSDVLGRILQGAGFPGFLGNLDALYDRADAEGAAWRALVGAWWQTHEGTPLPAGELFPLVAETESDLLINGRDEVGRKKSFGKALARVQDRVFSIDIDGTPLRLQLADGGSRHKTRLWRLARVEEGGIVGLGAFRLPHARTNNFLDDGIEKNPLNPPNPPAWPADGLWHGGEFDQLVTVTGVLGAQDGVTYYAIAGSQTGVPAHEVDFFDEPSQEVLL